VLTGTDETGQDFWAMRLTSVGTPDPTFGKVGVVTTDVLEQREDDVNASAVQPDGKLVLAGWSSKADTGSMSLVRYLDDGKLDPSFGSGGADGDGKVLLPNLTGIHATAILFQAEGRIAVVGDVGSGGRITVYRFDAHGEPDAQQPAPVELVPGGAFAYDATASADGKILVLAGVDGAAVIARLTAAGALDTTFGEGGTITLPEIDQPSAIKPLPDGRLLVAGVAGTDAQGKTAIMRLDAKGTVDRAFGAGGVAVADFPGGEWSPRLMVQRDGKLLVSTTLTTQYEFAAARFTAAGAPDATYRGGGLFTFPVLSLSAVFAADATPNDELILAGAAYKAFPVGQLAAVQLQADPPLVPGGGGTPSGPAGGEVPPADTQPPALNRVRVLRKAPGARLRIAFTVSEPARVRLTVRRRHGHARRVTIDARAGVNRVRVGRRLRAGRHTLAAKAVDAAGNVSAVRRVHFTAAT
jgi:uncharacterized delta-60 repeat protein